MSKYKLLTHSPWRRFFFLLVNHQLCRRKAAFQHENSKVVGEPVPLAVGSREGFFACFQRPSTVLVDQEPARFFSYDMSHDKELGFQKENFLLIPNNRV